MAKRIRVYMVHYLDKAGITQRVRVAAASEKAAKKRVELREGSGCVKEVCLALPGDKIRPLTEA